MEKIRFKVNDFLDKIKKNFSRIRSKSSSERSANLFSHFSVIYKVVAF